MKESIPKDRVNHLPNHIYHFLAYLEIVRKDGIRDQRWCKWVKNWLRAKYILIFTYEFRPKDQVMAEPYNSTRLQTFAGLFISTPRFSASQTQVVTVMRQGGLVSYTIAVRYKNEVICSALSLSSALNRDSTSGITTGFCLWGFMYLVCIISFNHLYIHMPFS